MDYKKICEIVQKIRTNRKFLQELEQKRKVISRDLFADKISGDEFSKKIRPVNLSRDVARSELEALLDELEATILTGVSQQG